MRNRKPTAADRAAHDRSMAAAFPATWGAAARFRTLPSAEAVWEAHQAFLMRQDLAEDENTAVSYTHPADEPQ